MATDDRDDAAEALLRARGAEGIDHPGGTLLAHLRRVSRLLAEWGADRDVQLAGLCHAAYGTDGFGIALLGLDERVLLVEAIGERAEALVYLYASCDREATYPQLSKPVVIFTDRFDGSQRAPTPSALRAFVEITAANELDVVRHNDELAREYGAQLAQLFADAGTHLSEPACQAWRGRKATAP